jgi:hypothetical protein
MVEQEFLVEHLAPLLETEQPIQVAVAVAALQTAEELPPAATAALALLSLKCLTTYPQHSLVALHLACPHLSLGSTSTL